MNLDLIEIKKVENDLGQFCYFDVTINGDTWSCATKKDCLEMAEEILCI